MKTIRTATGPMKLSLHDRKVDLTALEVAALVGFHQSEFHDTTIPVNQVSTWTFSVLDNAPENLNKKNFAGVMASLVKKGIVLSSPGSKGEPGFVDIKDVEVYVTVINTWADACTEEAIAQESVTLAVASEAVKEGTPVVVVSESEEPVVVAPAVAPVLFSIPKQYPKAGVLTPEQEACLEEPWLKAHEETRNVMRNNFIRDNTQKSDPAEMKKTRDILEAIAAAKFDLENKDVQNAGWRIRELIIQAADWITEYQRLGTNELNAGTYQAISTIARQHCI